MRNIRGDVYIKRYIVELVDLLIAKFADLELVGKYDVYEGLPACGQERRRVYPERLWL